MAEYIDKEIAMMVHEPPKSQRYYQTDNLDDAYGQGWDDALNAIGKLPKANVKEIVYGKWIPTKYPFMNECEDCSSCGYRTVWGHRYNYCPNCGAKMDKQNEPEN